MIKTLRRIDFLLLLPALLLSAFGLLMIYSLSFESEPVFFVRQAAYILLSLAIYLIIANFDFKVAGYLAIFLYVFLLIILVFTLVFGSQVRGSVRWLDFGLVRVQGAELAKPVLALALAGFFARCQAINLKSFLVSGLIAAGPVVLIAIQPSLSNSLILASLWAFMVFVAGANLLYLIGLSISFALAAPIIWNFFLASYQKMRIIAFFNPDLDPQGASYNIVQALIAFGSGQLFGRGLGHGTQSHLAFLPEGRTDFILAAAGEELGFFGIALILLVFAFLVYYILKIARSLKSSQAALFAYGAAFVIAFQLFVNAGMNIAILPISGVTLPFVSYGGSSILSFFIWLGLIQAAKTSDLAV